MSVAITLAAAAAVLIILAAVGMVVVAMLASRLMARRSPNGPRYPHPDLKTSDARGPLRKVATPYVLTATVEDVALRVARHILQGVNILLVGEPGVGKSAVVDEAMRLAYGSPHDIPYEAHSGAVLRSDRALSDLFGHEEGAFTDAKGMRVGLFERLAGGVLFVDEVHALPSEAQSMMLQALGGGGYRRVGGAELREVDTVVVSATNRDLSAEVAAGHFAPDLASRLVARSITIPPLRHRRGEAIEIATRALGAWGVRVEADMWQWRVLRHHWPGNVRQLLDTLRSCVDPITRELDVEELAEAIDDDGDDPAAGDDFDGRWLLVRSQLEREGRRDFTTAEWATWADVSPRQAGKDVRRARNAGWLSSSGKGPARRHVVEKCAPQATI